MADNSYKVEAEISTSNSVTNLRSLNKAIDETASALRALNTVTKAGEADLKSMAASITQVLAAQRAATIEEKNLAQARIATAKANAIEQATLDKSNESYLKQEGLLQRAIAAEQRNAQTSASNAAKQDQAEQALWNRRTKAMADWANQQNQGIAAEQRAGQAEEALFTRRQQAMAEWTRQQQQGITAEQQRTSSNQRQAQSELELQDNLSNTRYLLYDVSAEYRTLSLVMEAVPAAVTAVAVAYQRDFAQVLRISGQTTEAAQSLRDGLIQLTQDVPVSFEQATQIAQLGAHLQLGNEGLVAFTDTVAKFTAATGVAADTSSQMFSRMKTAMADSKAAGTDYFNKLGSSIAQMGTVVVATDQEVASMVTQINAVTASAGIGTSATVGLAGAMASLRIQPEMARGALTRLFANFNRDSADSTEKMAKFGQVMGMTGQQATALWKSDPTTFFTDLVKGLNDAYKNGQNLTVLFDDMGIKNVRDVNTLQRLAVGYDVLTKSMAAANDGYQKGTALNDLSKPVFETAAAKLQELGNAFKALGDALGSGALAPLSVFMDALKGLVEGITNLAKTQPVIMTILNAFLGFSMIAGALFGLKAAQAAVLAGLVSFQQVLGSAAQRAMGFNGIIRQVAVIQLMAKGATAEQAAALIKEASAFGAVTIAAKLTNEQIALMNVEGQASVMTMAELGAAASTAGVRMGGAGTAMKGMLNSVLGLVGGLPGLITLVGVGLVSSFVSAQQAGDDLAKTLGENLSQAGADAGKAAADFLKGFKVSNDPTGGIGLDFGSYDKSLAEIAVRAGVDMQKLKDALTNGKQGLADFKNYMDGLAKDNGFAGGMGEIGLSGGLPGTKAADLYFIQQAIEREAGKAQDAASANKQVDSAMANAGGTADKVAGQVDDNTDSLDQNATAADKLDKALKAMNDTIFGSLDAQTALGDSLEKLGEGLQKSGQFNNSEDGRANVKNMEDTLKAAQDYYALQVKTNALSKDQATMGYGKFVNDLIAKAKAQGANLGPIEDLAHQTVDTFKQVIGTDASGPNAPKMQVQVNTVQPIQQAQTVGQQVSAVLAAEKPTLDIEANSDQASQQVTTLALSIAKLTGMPVEVVIDALTNPASDKAKAVQDFINKVVKDPKTFAVDADTTAAVQNVQNFASYAAKQLAAVQSYVNSVAASAPVLSQFIVPGVKPNLTGTPYKPGLGGGSLPTMQTVAAPAQVAATNAQTQAQAGLGNVLDNVNAGYDKQQAAADKAGKSGSKAGKDSANAWQDAGNAIDEATSKADDYASRLKQGLDRAFEKQYGVQTATDAYYQKLNEIKKAREDELKQVDDLHDKIKSLNDEMNKDKIDAGKAKIEQQISLKYGEADRAVDYGNQAQTALDNAAAKQKEIDADNKQANEIQAGIGLLTGYSDAAIKNRQDLRDLEQKQLDMVVAYAKTGASIDQVRAYAQNLDAQFQNDVTQIGFNRQAVQNLTGDLGRYIDVINRVPYEKPTKITADPSQAEDAIKGVGSDFNALGDQMANNPLDITLRANWDWDVKQISSTMWSAISNQMGVDMGSGPVKISNYDGGVVQGFAGGGMIPGTPPSNPQQDNMFAKVDGKGFITVRSGEGIMTEPAMKYYGGAGFLDALNKMKLPRYAMGGVVGRSSASSADPGVVSLDAASIAAVADALSIRLEIDGHEIGRAANRYNRDNASMGGRR